MWSSVMHTIAKIFSWFLVSCFTRVRHLYVSIIARRVGKAKGVFEDSEAVAGTGFAVCPNRVNGSPLPGGDFARCGVRGTCAVQRGNKKGRHLRFLPSLNTRFPCGAAWVQMVDCVSVEKGNGRGFFLPRGITPFRISAAVLLHRR